MAVSESPLEQAVVASFPWLAGGLVAAMPLLLFTGSADRRWDLLIQLTALVLFAWGLTWKLAPLSDERWFRQYGWTTFRRTLSGAVSLIIVVTGVTALVTLATTAALRYEPSLQFLQLLSALDIAWVVSGTTIAARSLWGRSTAVAAGIAMSAVCIGSIALYLGEVGLSADGGWLVDSEQVLRLVIPFDVAAATMTIGFTLLAAKKSADAAGKTPVV